ncbi:hypothetical protein CMK12_17500 [Candidatus Poribacteria bacterium]|jgi:CcmD family protein|nr:hypothetical protein [Candidatus Poribacteria bacterium]MDP6598349.1 CcmD family protein [Candidatus Poribacteria bacterium]MDP6748908.1 CcmD family protein [Candidatus Poribacteria bacterium]MDP6995797.1 CcmD family protein [Candidatus Poribacteria bacterium]
MSKFNLITIVVAFLTFTTVFNITRQPDIIVPGERIETTVSDILGNDTQYDETEIQQIVTQAIQILNDGQSRRLKYLISAYFVVWLILMLYIFHLSQKQEQLQTELDLLNNQLQPDKAKEDRKGI